MYSAALSAAGARVHAFTRWQTIQLNQSPLNDPNVSSWTADPDKDGIENGAEYFLTGDPLAGITTSDSLLLPQASITTFGASRYLTFTYHHPVSYDGTPETISLSDNLATWDETGNQLELVSGPTPTGDGLTEQSRSAWKHPSIRAPWRASSSG